MRSLAIVLLLQLSSLAAAESRFSTTVLSEAFHSEGAAVADIDGDGHRDVVSGPYWYRGPQFRQRFAYADAKRYSIKGYSDHFFSFARDLSGDGRADVLSIPIPGGPAVWYENPSDPTEPWTSHPVLSDVSNESPTMADIDGDGVDELVCIHGGRYGYAEPGDDPRAEWQFRPISDKAGYGRFTHGLGVGDVNGDGRQDLLEKDGWWEQPESPDASFRFHPVKFAEAGGSQMFVYDFDGDGDNDVISSQNAHAYGLCWFERRGAASDEPVFIKHSILGRNANENPYGLAISQMHAVALADIDGDGVKDIVTGKRFWAHGGGDPGAQELPVLYWFRTTRSKYGVDFVPMLIDVRVGVGTQLTVEDVDQNGHVDVVVGNKLGTFIAFNSGRKDAEPEPTDVARHTIGTEEFRSGVRSTEPLTPEAEQETFVLPAGFRAELVASEPDIAKPMNLAFDHRGRLWVSSSVEYPYAAAEGEGRDTVKVFEDSTGDGRYDKITTFADGLNIPIGLYPYGDGVICFSIPNILYLSDTDGDGKADRREVLYGPFDTTRDTHGMCNAFTRGYDGWLYACHGFNNQSSVAGADGNIVSMHSGNTFRMRLDGSRIEHFTHGQVNPFGMAIDPRGDLLTADCHTKPVTLLLNGGFYPSFGKPHDGLGFVPDVMQHLHGSTAIGGLALYHDDRFPAEYQGNAFGGNVMTSRINRNSIVRRGASIRAQEEPDFLISGDPWFRPVDLQLGPDGALYVADFYNRIIGHYEVPLTHPGRDRYRGRIWRIVYEPTVLRPSGPTAIEALDETEGQGTRLQMLIRRLSSTNLARRMLATDELVDRFGAQAAEPLRRLLAEGSTDGKIHSLWALYRLKAIRRSDLEEAAREGDPRIRTHAMQLIGSLAPGEFPADDLLLKGLDDPDPHVRRSAALASATYRSTDLAAALLRTLSTTPASDVHLRHALRMSLRDHLADAKVFDEIASGIDGEQQNAVVELCLAIKTDYAGEYVAKNLHTLTDVDQERLSEFLTFASRYAPQEQLAPLVRMARERFADQLSFQTSLLRSIHRGLLQRGAPIPAVISDWSESLARAYLGMKPGQERLPAGSSSIGWTYVANSGAPRQENPWTSSTKRNSADGEKASLLHSSFPKGESKVGTYRSDVFVMPERFGFYFAGHDGYPDKPIQHKNLVRVRDARSHAELCSWNAPRNDTAQPVQWDSGEHAGKRCYIELVDGDSARAFAWIAVGRFSVQGLNPSRCIEQRRTAASLVKDFRLTSLAAPMRQLMSDAATGPADAALFADALIIDRNTAVRSATAEALAIQGLSRVMSEQLHGALDAELGSENTALAEAMKVATSAEQMRVARRLSADRDGVAALITLVESGAASSRLLTDAALSAKVASLATAEQAERAQSLIADLPQENQEAAEAMARRKTHYLTHSGDPSGGSKVFQVQCGICHKVAGKGAEVGPNLDGIGNRGLDRILEDVMLPNRNVDAAFRASLILTDDGRVISGLVKRTEGAQLIVVDDKGKEQRVPQASIEEQRQIRSSPMPSNVHENLNDEAMSDLLAYLLSLVS